MLRSRIAPTPSGFLHKGNVFNFILASRIASGGELVLRIDDLDQDRMREEYIQDIFDTLRWLNIKCTKGPAKSDELSQFSQLNHLTEYHSHINRLKSAGHLFACNCTRSMLNNTGTYTGECMHKNLPFTDDVNWRLISPQQPVVFYDSFSKKQKEVNLFETMRHPIIKKRDGFPAYQIASLADDVRMRINTVVRGEDLLSSTATQLYMARLLGLHSFMDASFFHHPIIKEQSGEKLSKSAGSNSIKEYRRTHSVSEIYDEFELWMNKITGS